MPKIYPDRLDNAIAISEGQDGYFTTEQARDAGLSLHALVGLEQAGHLEREQYGVYHLSRWPSSKRPGLWRSFLWATRVNPCATFSHRSALAFHSVSDINPSKIDVTFPFQTRIGSGKPPAVVTHRRDVPEDQIEECEGLRTTTLYRTLLDLATDRLARDAVAHVLDSGGSSSLTTEELRQIRAVFDLSDETRQYLGRALSRSRRSPGKP